MDRTSFYDIIMVNGIEEYDYLNNNLSKFTMTYPVHYYRIEESDIMRPDLISYKVYGSENYWWLICMINGIEDIFNDMTLGKLLTIPNVLDIYAFRKQFAIR